MKKATLLLELIEAMLQRDQGTRFREFLQVTMPNAADAYAPHKPPFREHLGASLIGRDCHREIWYKYRWSSIETFDGRMLRLFNRGHLEEPRFIALLLMTGCNVWELDENGRQFGFKAHEGHFAGAVDCVVAGIPDDPSTPMLCEFKTSSAKIFEKVKANGVQQEKWEHWSQMQVYMGELKLQRALYMMVNKDNDEIHAELCDFDAVTYERLKAKALAIIQATTPPERISNDPSWFKCRFCSSHHVCHDKGKAIKICRTCKLANIVGTNWICTKTSSTLDKDAQLKGCGHHSPIF